VAEKFAQANGITLAYETFGDPADPPMLLVMGLGTQMLGWPEGLCQQLADAGFYVIRFDNRDIGRSTHLDDAPTPNPVAVALRRRRPAYQLDDLATDTIGLMYALGLDRVHLVGASMGGFIAQLVATRVPDRIASLSVFMTSTGSRLVGQAAPRIVRAVLTRKPATGRSGAVAASMAMQHRIGSPGYPVDDDVVRDLAERSYDRGYDPAGSGRQLAAVIAQTDRSAELGRLTMPTLVLHGLSDPLVSVSGGIAVARAIPGSRFVGFHGMGHDLPRALWPEFVAEIGANTRRAVTFRPTGG
jgi:pimeloyl-ACP methyl ester carboxylesterase